MYMLTSSENQFHETQLNVDIVTYHSNIIQPMTNTTMKSHKYGMNLGQLTIKLAKKTSLV